MLCPDATTPTCSLGAWPGGTVYYGFAPSFGEKLAARSAMDRWEAASSHAVRFVEDATKPAKVTITACTDGTEPGGYAACANGCTAQLCGDGIDHALGHVLGLRHEQERYDRDHYLRINAHCDDPSTEQVRCGAADDASDLGPFDYASAMLNSVVDPDYTRWDGSQVCTGHANQACPAASTGPGGYPTALDGAAVMDLYQTQSGWQKFTRTVDTTAASPYDPAKQAPFDDALSPTVKIPSTASPAVETWEGDSLAIYVTGSDGNVYKKYLDGGWTAWESLGQPAGSGSVSDPAITSWTPGRSDLVVRRGDSVYIMSTPTWDNWQSIGAPSSPAVSAPAITTWGENRLDVFVRGADNQIYHRSCTDACVGSAGTWSDWAAVYGGLLRSKPAAIARAKGVIDLFGHGMGEDLWAAHYDENADPQWTTWTLIDASVRFKWDPACQDCSGLTAGSHDGSTADVYFRTANDTIATGSIAADGTWSGFSILGGKSSGSPGTVTETRATNRIDLVTIMPEEWRSGEPHYGTWWKSRAF
jgi:hypothetical protein